MMSSGEISTVPLGRGKLDNRGSVVLEEFVGSISVSFTATAALSDKFRRAGGVIGNIYQATILLY